MLSFLVIEFTNKILQEKKKIPVGQHLEEGSFSIKSRLNIYTIVHGKQCQFSRCFYYMSIKTLFFLTSR